MARLRWIFVALLVAACGAPLRAQAAPWLWDRNDNRIDDRIEAVNLDGLAAAHVNNDLGKRLRIFVYPDVAPLQYGVYVGFDHSPTDTDVARLQSTGATLTWRARYIPYLRARGTFAQVQALAALDGVTRVEAWQPMYPTNDNATRAMRARPAAGGVGNTTGMFPSVWADAGLTGRGVVVGILDSGVNDDAYLTYPGHQSLKGKFVGGGDFSNPVAAFNTPVDSSANPRNTLDPEGTYHGTHVAGIAIGSGGPQGVLAPGASYGRFAGLAPDAYLVDCKVLTDAGLGGGAAEALEWCIAHRNTVWGTDAWGNTLKGVQVVNMSIGGTTESDGTDADCAAVNAAVKAGIVVCVATGNDGNTGYMPSPAAADLDIAVGALQDRNTVARGDDIVDSYSNEGPRMADTDTDHVDEMKPSVCGSGSDIVSANGDPTTDGAEYHNINGTSMASPNVAGICALILQANPGLTPAEVRALLQDTADHRRDNGQQPPSAADPFGVDPNYHPSWGWGEPDAYAAVKEALNPATTQVIAEYGTPAILGGQLQIAVRWVTQREIGVAHFDVYRAPDLGGYPGAFAAVSPPVAPVGQAVIERTSNRTPYLWTDTDAALVAGTPYWYQVRWTDAQSREHVEPSFRVTTNTPPVRARVTWAITHDALDNDVFARFGSGTDPDHAPFLRACPGRPAADSFQVVGPAFGDGLNRYFFHTDLTDEDAVGNFLPPSAANPWFLAVTEEGFVNTEGAVDSFAVTVYSGNTATVYRALNPVTPLVERTTTTFWIPLDPITTLNHTPVLNPVGNRTVQQGVNLHITVSGSDPDGDALTYSTGTLPLGASFNAGTRTFSWQPGLGQTGTFNVAFRVRDPMLAQDEEIVTITVTPGNGNTAPVLDALADRTVHVSSTLQFTVTATDQQNDPLTYSATPLPPHASINGSTGAFQWSPLPGDEGSYSVTFRVVDTGSLDDERTVILTATPTTPPVFVGECEPDTVTITGTIGVDVQGVLGVYNLHAFDVGNTTNEIVGDLTWLGGPATDLDLYLLDPFGNTVGSGATATDDPEHMTYTTPVAGTYQWKVVSFTNPIDGLEYSITSVQCKAGTAAVEGPVGGVEFALGQNAPNPFSRSSVVRFSLPRAGRVDLSIFDIAGRKVKTLFAGEMQPGYHQRVWDGTEESGTRAHAGVYFYRLEAGRSVLARKMIMVH